MRGVCSTGGSHGQGTVSSKCAARPHQAVTFQPSISMRMTLATAHSVGPAHSWACMHECSRRGKRMPHAVQHEATQLCLQLPFRPCPPATAAPAAPALRDVGNTSAA